MPVPYDQGPGMPPPHQGQAWGDPYGQGGGMYGHGHPTPPECSSAKAIHIGAIFGPVVALIMYLMKKDESPYVRYHAAQALNFQILMMIGYFISGVLMINPGGAPDVAGPADHRDHPGNHCCRSSRLR